MTAEDHVTYVVQNHVGVISMSRPSVNALNVPMLEKIIAFLKSAAGDSDVRAVVIQSALPKCFCAGLDLAGLIDQPPAEARRLLETLYVELFDAQYTLGKPSIAAIGGAARGGGMTLSISCDVILADEGASFGYPEIDIGVLPAIHFVHLPRIIGRHRAFELLFSGRTFDPAEAAALGLVSRVVPKGEVQAAALKLATDFAGKPPAALRIGRAAFMRMNDLDYRRNFGAAVENFCNVFALDEAREGLSAFLEKRPPKWI